MSHVLLRSPLSSYKTLEPLFRAENFDELERHLKAKMRDPIFRRALELSNPSFCDRLSKKEKWSRGEIVTMTKYVLRSASRPTPFGLFGLVSAVPLDQHFAKCVLAPVDLNEKVELEIPDFDKAPREYVLNPTLRDRGTKTFWHRLSKSESYRYVQGALIDTPETRRLAKTPIETRIRPQGHQQQFTNLWREGLLLDANLSPFMSIASRRADLGLTQDPNVESRRYTIAQRSILSGSFAQSRQDSLKAALSKAYPLLERLSHSTLSVYSELVSDFYEAYDLEPVDFLEFADRFAARLANLSLQTNALGSLPKRIREAARAGERTVVIHDADLDELPSKEGAITGDAIFQIYESGHLYALKTFSAWGAGRTLSRFSRLGGVFDDVYQSAAELNAHSTGPLELHHVAHEDCFPVTLRKPTRFKKLDVMAPSSKGSLKLKDVAVQWSEGHLDLINKKTRQPQTILVQTAQTLLADTSPHMRLLMMIASRGRCTHTVGSAIDPSEGVLIPRVLYRGVILSRARWRVPAAYLSRALRDQQLSELAKQLGLPQRVLLVEGGDHELLIDLTHFSSLSVLKSKEGRAFFEFVEFLDDEFESAICSAEGSHVAEAVIPFAIGRGTEVFAARKVVGANKTIEAYREIEIEAEPVLHASILTQLARFFEKAPKLYGSFWFTRYELKNPSLRLRVQIREPSAIARLERSLERFRQKGLLFDWTFRRYRRELSQYGGLGPVQLYEKVSVVQSSVAIDFERLKTRFDFGERSPFGPSTLSLEFALACAWQDIQIFKTHIDRSKSQSNTANVKVRKPRNLTDKQRMFVRQARAKFYEILKSAEAFPAPIEALLKRRGHEMKRLLSRNKSKIVDFTHFEGRLLHMNMNRLLTANLSLIEPTLLSIIDDFTRALTDSSQSPLPQRRP